MLSGPWGGKGGGDGGATKGSSGGLGETGTEEGSEAVEKFRGVWSEAGQRGGIREQAVGPLGAAFVGGNGKAVLGRQMQH